MYAVVGKHVFPFLRTLGAEGSTYSRSDDLDLFTRDVGALREAFDELPEIATSIGASGLPEPLPFGRTAFRVPVGASIVKVDFVTDRGPLLSPPRNLGPA